MAPPDDMVAVPAGSFVAGCDPVRSMECMPGATPYRAEVAAFEIDRTEVTIAQYEDCIAAGACARVPDPVGMARRGTVVSSLPVWDVSGGDARAYCRWVGKRLPSELEWEKAARGTDGRPYPWGDAAPSCELAALPGCGSTFGAGHLRAPGSAPAGKSPYRAVDMFGNVGEWAESARDGTATDDVIGVGPARIVTPGHDITLGHRYPTPATAREFWLSPFTGFRCARSLPR